jgi:asparagine synthetase B (glutamine-hydrolysing)
MRSVGPDGEGLRIADDQRAGLAHRRLANIHLSDAGSARSRAGTRALPADKLAMANAPLAKLPAGMLNRRKNGFSVPVRDWLTQQPDQTAYAEAKRLRGCALQLHRQQGPAVA